MKLKKFLSGILAVLMLLSVCTVAVSAEDDLPFTDVTVGGWSYEGIKFAYENGLMNGTGGSCFSPGVDVTRGMVVTVLYRLEGSPRIKFKELFLDIEERLYYTEAVLWAKEQGIVTATSTNEWSEEYFTPDRSITRQELATMFVRYAKYKNINTANTATLDRFTDKDSVATWAADAMKWATSVGLINGTGNGDTLSPTMTATREQFATIMHRFDTIEFDYDLNYAEAQEISKYTEPDYPLVNDADVYVAVDGHDSNPGTLEKPLATFDAARLKVRELKKTAKDEIVVAFKAGNYGYLENVTFTEEDGGSETVPIKYCKYGDGDVIFQNGIVIKENEFTLVDESEKSMFPKGSRDHIYKVDLTGRLDKFEFKTRIFGETGYPTEAREPNNSYYSNMTTTVDDHESIQLQLALPGIVEKLRSVDGMKISGYLRAGYIFDYFPVKSYDAESDILIFDFENYEFDPVSGFTLDEYPLMYEGRTDDLVYFSNLPEFIDLPGEYWFDNSTSTLYIYYARGDYAIDAGGTYVTVNKGAEYLSFVGLEFNGSSEDAFVVNADHFTMDMCKIGNIAGMAAVHMPSYVRNLTIKNSEFYNCVDHCIYLYSNMNRDDYTLTDNKRYLIPGNNVITNNYFHDFTLPEYFSSAISITDDVGTEISHNYFFQGGHGAIRLNCCVDTKIEYNVFDEIMMKTQDYGAVYMWNAITYRDNHIRYNIFKNIPVYSIYLDNNTAGQYVYGNVFYKGGVGVVQNGGRDNHIYDNVFIDSSIGYSMGLYSYYTEGNTDKIHKAEFYHRYMTAKPQPGEDGYTEWYARWPEIYDTSFDPADVGSPNCIYTPLTHSSGNAGFDVKVNDVGPEYVGVDDTNKNYRTNENPLFVNPSIGDYSIREDVDFFKIPYDRIGRY